MPATPIALPSSDPTPLLGGYHSVLTWGTLPPVTILTAGTALTGYGTLAVVPPFTLPTGSPFSASGAGNGVALNSPVGVTGGISPGSVYAGPTPTPSIGYNNPGMYYQLAASGVAPSTAAPPPVASSLAISPPTLFLGVAVLIAAFILWRLFRDG